LKINVTVKPSSKKGPLVKKAESNDLIVFVRQSAHEGKANKKTIELLSDYLRVPKTRIRLIRGATSKNKTFEINN
jgi:uncharacterized protein YggU (UPF0235/DUF167 family)